MTCLTFLLLPGHPPPYNSSPRCKTRHSLAHLGPTIDLSLPFYRITRAGTSNSSVSLLLPLLRHHWLFSLSWRPLCLTRPSCPILQLKSTPVPCYGGSSTIPGLTNQVHDDSTFTIGADLDVKCVHNPCHTQDSISYFVTDKKTGDKAVFTGDTLFTGEWPGRDWPHPQGHGVAMDWTRLTGLDSTQPNSRLRSLL